MARGGARVNHPCRGDLTRVPALGRGVWIDRFAWFSIGPDGRLEIGPETYIGRNLIVSCHERVAIGPRNVLAERVLLTDANHDYTAQAPLLHSPRRDVAPVVTGPDCWIGVGACLLAGATLGRNCVVGANSVVVGPVADFTVVAGVPARPVRRRNAATGVWEAVGQEAG
jgi:acetyltransferase-like isoleucine patch superfamily enzyme